jgi:nucleoside-diphosphate-sugar epimerase
MEGFDFVIHLAASTSMWPPRNNLVRDVNVTGRINVMNAAKKPQLSGWFK